MTYRVHYRISGWVEVEAKNLDDAFDAVDDYTPGTFITETIGTPYLDVDEAEVNP